MATGAFILAASYLLLAAVATQDGGTAWQWVAMFFVIMTAGELYILPVGLSLFGRLAPKNRTATTLAAWFLATSVGSLLAGVVGSLWSQFTPATFFVFIAAIACLAALLLKLIDRPARRAMLS